MTIETFNTETTETETIDTTASKKFARERRLLGLRRDACGDPVIYGTVSKKRDGEKGERQLYFDGGELCLVILDCRPVIRRRWKELDARRLWLGDISPDGAGRRVQDVKVMGIPVEKAKLAIQLAHVKHRQNLTEAQRNTRRAAAQKLAGARTARKTGATTVRTQPRAPEHAGRPQSDAKGYSPAQSVIPA